MHLTCHNTYSFCCQLNTLCKWFNSKWIKVKKRSELMILFKTYQRMKSLNYDQNNFHMRLELKKGCQCFFICVKYYITEGSRLNFFPVCGSCLFFNFSRTSCSAIICKIITILDPFPEIIQNDWFFSNVPSWKTG